MVHEQLFIGQCHHRKPLLVCSVPHATADCHQRETIFLFIEKGKRLCKPGLLRQYADLSRQYEDAQRDAKKSAHRLSAQQKASAHSNLEPHTGLG
eukprot:1159017-Pelagomonas_calceolata.AAC.6